MLARSLSGDFIQLSLQNVQDIKKRCNNAFPSSLLHQSFYTLLSPAYYATGSSLPQQAEEDSR